MQLRPYQQLNPLAMGVAFGCAALICTALAAFPMAGMMGGYGHGYGRMMWGGPGFGFGPLNWIGGALLAAVAGALIAWIYNVVNALQSKTGGVTKSGPESGLSGTPTPTK